MNATGAAASRPTYRLTECKTALNRVAGMDFKWSLNPYRGCVHGCHYCFARRYHAHLELDPGDDFTGIIFVKGNCPEVLARELSRRSWRRDTVAVGTATDPYQPIEGKYRLTRHCLEAFAAWRTPVALLTKGTLAVRDVDVLQELTRKTDSTVCFSVTTVDRETARRLEPGTPPPEKRLLAMSRLVDAGIDAGVALAPVVPGITDGRANIEAVVRAAADHGARFLWSSALYLKPGTKEHFLDFVGSEYPSLRHEYRRMYPGAYAPSYVQRRVSLRVDDAMRERGLSSRPPRRRPTPVQLRMESITPASPAR